MIPTSSKSRLASNGRTRLKHGTTGECFSDSGLGPATQQLLDMARVAEGSRVLDVAAGAGDQTLLIAERVGAKGHVLATDISSNILEFAPAKSKRACAKKLYDM